MDKKKNLTKAQFRKKQISLLWREYKRKRAALDKELEDVSNEKHFMVVEATNSVCIDPRLEEIDGQMVYTCENAQGVRVLCF